MLAKLKAGLDRIEATREADLIGAAVVFALPILALFLGALIDGGL